MLVDFIPGIDSHRFETQVFAAVSIAVLFLGISHRNKIACLQKSLSTFFALSLALSLSSALICSTSITLRVSGQIIFLLLSVMTHQLPNESQDISNILLLSLVFQAVGVTMSWVCMSNSFTMLKYSDVVMSLIVFVCVLDISSLLSRLQNCMDLLKPFEECSHIYKMQVIPSCFVVLMGIWGSSCNEFWISCTISRSVPSTQLLLLSALLGWNASRICVQLLAFINSIPSLSSHYHSRANHSKRKETDMIIHDIMTTVDPQLYISSQAMTSALFFPTRLTKSFILLSLSLSLISHEP